MILEQLVDAKDLLEFIKCLDSETLDKVELEDWGNDYCLLKVFLNSNKAKS